MAFSFKGYNDNQREKKFSLTVHHLNGLGERKMKIDIVCQSNAHFLLTNANIYGSWGICVDKWHCRGRKSRVFLLSAASSFFGGGAAFQSAAEFQHTMLVKILISSDTYILTGGM